MVSLSLDTWVFIILMRYSTILDTLDILLMESGDSRSCTANSDRFIKIYQNICLLLVHHFIGIIRQVPLACLIPVTSGDLGKAVGFFSKDLWQRLPGNVIGQ